MSNLNELHSHLTGCRLEEPPDDTWESYKRAISTFVDCWYDGASAQYETTETSLIVKVNDEPIIQLYYGEGEWPLAIRYGEDYERFDFARAKRL